MFLLGGVALARVWDLLQRTPLSRADWLAAPVGTALALWLLAANVVIYFFEYTPRVERAESTYMAREMRERGDAYRYYFLTEPHYQPNLPSVEFIANQIKADNVKGPDEFKVRERRPWHPDPGAAKPSRRPPGDRIATLRRGGMRRDRAERAPALPHLRGAANSLKRQRPAPGGPMPRVDYDLIAPLYDEPIREHPVDARLLEFLGERKDLDGTAVRVLDVGCGTGQQLSANRSGD